MLISCIQFVLHMKRFQTRRQTFTNSNHVWLHWTYNKTIAVQNITTRRLRDEIIRGEGLFTIFLLTRIYNSSLGIQHLMMDDNSFKEPIISPIHFSLFSFGFSQKWIIIWYTGLLNRVFTHSLGDRGSILSRIIPKTRKIVLTYHTHDKDMRNVHIMFITYIHRT